MGKRVATEGSEKNEDHPQEKDVRSTNVDGGVAETSVNCSSGVEDSKVSGTVTTPPQPAMAEDAEEYIKPIIKDGEVILEVECGQNKALLYLSKLCQGSKGPCIYFQGSWLAPNEFQYVSGRETAKDWKRSIRHHGKSLKLLLAKGILTVHPTVCDCEGCRTGSTLNRNRNGTKKKTATNKESKPKIPADCLQSASQDASKPNSLPLSSQEQDKSKKESKKVNKKSSDKPVSPLRESKSTNIMNPTALPQSPTSQDRVPKVPIVVPCPVVPGAFPVPKVPVLSPVKPESKASVSKIPSPPIKEIKQEETLVKSEAIPVSHRTPVKLSDVKCKSGETVKTSPAPVVKPNPDVCKENYIKDDKTTKDTILKEKQKEVTKEVKQNKPELPKVSSFESPVSKDSSRSPSEDHSRRHSDKEAEKLTPKSYPGVVPRLGSDVPAFRLPETSTDAAVYADYMRMLTGGHPLLPPAPTPMDPLYSIRASDPSFNHVLHPYHGCAMYNPHPGLYQKDPVLYPTTAGALPSSIAAPCFSPMHMFSQRLPYALSSPVMDLPRPFQYMPAPTSMSYPCSSISGLKRHHSDLESSQDIVSKRLRLDYQVPDFRFDSYPSCSTTYPSLYYDTSALLQNEELRRKRLEESIGCGKDIPGYLNPYMTKPGYHCSCGNRQDDIRNWSVEDVCSFVSRLDGCGLFAETFREQRVDGKILILLTTDHMMKNLGLKLGPAVLIAEAVTKKLHEARLNGCESCRKLSLGAPVEI